MTMPPPPPMALQLYHSEPQPYDSAYQPPIYEQPAYESHYDQPDLTSQTPRLASPDAWWKQRRVWAIAGGGLALVTVIIAVAATRGGPSLAAKDAMVRVTTPSGTGAGFFIAGPDGYAYVATANHVVDRGERILVERDVGEDKQSFVEAYPETEIVAADPDADLAIIRIKNVDAGRFPMMALAKQPTKDERILSYGYPGSSLASKTGLVSKDGKVLSLVSFPAYDERYQRILRDNAVDGLLISTDIEPGMSGGPTTNDAGEVVGVNVTKDRAHVGQNGAVSVVALRALLAKVKPASDRPQPSNDDVVKMLDRIQSDYLLLPLDERKKVRETEFVNAGDLPALRLLVGEVRREERNTDTSFIAKYRLSGQAALGMFFARMPGKLLETYRAPSTTIPLNACELANRRLTSFLGDLSTADKRIEPPKTKQASCDELAVRPLAWDLVAATLQWEGKEQRYTVTKIDKLDEDGKLYRAQVRIQGTSNLIELFLGMDQGAVRLKLFDPTNNLYAIKSPRNVPTSALQGTWSMRRPRVTDAINKNAEIESTETVSLSINDGKASIRYVVSEHYFGAGNRAQVFKCNGKKTIETGMLQSFSGTLENGVVVALPDKDAEPLGPDAAYCISSHRADRIIAVKLAGDQLLVYRTDGNAYPEAVQLTRDKDVAVPASTTP
jgi:Trypsin-like peptidase domain